MKYNINRLQGGGLVSFTPIIDSGQSQKGSVAQESQSTNKQSLLDEDAYKELIKSGGLVNDVNQFVEELQTLESDPTSFLQSNTRSQALRVIGKINELKQNKKMWEQAVDLSSKSGGLSEVAVGSMGELYTRDKNGKIGAISMQQYQKDASKYQLLSVSDLLNARQYDPSLSYNQGIFKVAEQSVGINNVMDHITGIISKLGKESQSTESYKSSSDIIKNYTALAGIKNPTAEQVQGLQELSNMYNMIGSGPDAVYKFTESATSNRGHLKEAFNYIWSTLPQNYQNKLKATVAVNGGDINNVGSLVANALGMFTTEETKDTIDYSKEVSGTSGDGRSESATTLTPLEILFSGKLDRGESFEWNDPETNKTMSIPITGRTQLFEKDSPTGMITLNQFNKLQMSQLVDTGNVTFGGKKISLSDADKIVYDGQQAARAYLPTNMDGTPNLTLLKQFNEAQSVVAEHPEWDDTTINEFYKERGMGFIKVDENRELLTNVNLRPFLIFHGYTTDESTVGDSDNKNIHHITGAEESDVENLLNNFYSANKLTSPTGWTGGDWSTNYYKGLVAMPILPDASAMAASMSGHMYAPKYNITDVRTNMAGRNIPSWSSSATLLQ